MSEFLKRITSKAVLDRFAEICEERPDIQVLNYILNMPRILEWVHSVGVVQDRILNSLAPPFPPTELRGITAAEKIEIFLWTGLVDLERMMLLYEKHRGTSAPNIPVLLDFGCGCGRMTRFLNDHAYCHSIYACDVNASHVDWCHENLRGIRTVQNNFLPPSPYREHMFNLIYSLSIFSHLPASSANRWLEDLYRILAPNGILIVTTHGYPALEIIRDSHIHQSMFNLTRDDVIDIISRLEEQRFIFSKYNEETCQVAQAGDEYGNTFIHPGFFHEKWQNGKFRVLEHLPGGLRSWQDIVILQRG